MQDVPRLVVNNCIDKVAGTEAGVDKGVVFVSAKHGLGKKQLLQAISTAIWGERGHFKVLVPDLPGQAAAALLRCGATPVADNDRLLELDIERGWLQELCARTGATVCE